MQFSILGVKVTRGGRNRPLEPTDSQHGVGMRAEVISIGDELTTGQRLDTNSQWISRELGVLGIPVAFHTTITDSLDDGLDAFQIAVARAEVVIVTGGLGPTADDLTREVLAAVAGEPLELVATALADVESRFANRGVAMPASNRQQAMFPRGSVPIPNPEGTAPGIEIAIPRAGGGAPARVFALPGVPGEMHSMWQATVGPALLKMLPEAGTIRFRRLKCFGAGESAIEAMLPDLIRRGRDPLVGITAHEATITLRIAARGDHDAACEEKIAPTEALIRGCLGELVYGTEDDEVEDAAIRNLAASGGSVATVEIGSLGLVAALLAQAAARETSGCFAGGVVLPLTTVLPVAELAELRRRETGATFALAVGPVVRNSASGSGRPADAVEMVLVGPAGAVTICHTLGGAGTVRLSRLAKTALDMLRKGAARSLPGTPSGSGETS